MRKFDAERSPRWVVWVVALLLGLSYAGLARLGLALVFEPLGIAELWPPSGLLFAVLVLAPRHFWFHLLAACFLAVLVVNLSTGQSLAVSLAYGLANCTESALAAAAFRWATTPPRSLTSLHQVVALLLVAVMISNGLTALIGAAIPALAFGAPFWATWQLWWTADGLSILLVGSTILTWSHSPEEYNRPTPWTLAEAVLATGIMLLVATYTFGAPPDRAFSPSPYLTFPVLLWVAVRFGPRGAAPIALLLAVITVWFTVIGRGPFAAVISDPLLRLREVQIFLLIEGVSALALAALTAERRRAQRELRQMNEVLEARVAERTAALAAANIRLLNESSRRAQAMSELHESQEQVRQAMRVARLFTFNWDYATDHISRSPHCGEILGLSGDEAITDTGAHFFQRLHPDDRELLVKTVNQLSPSNDTYRLIYRVLRPDGNLVILEEVGRAVFDHNGHYLRLFGISADVTDRQQAAARSARLQRMTIGLSAAHTPVEVAQVIVAQGVAVLEAMAGVIVVRIPDTDQLQTLAATGYAATSIKSWQSFTLTTPVPLAEAVRSGIPIWISGRANLLARYPALSTTPVHNRSFAALPLIVGGRVLGALGFSFAQEAISPDLPGYAQTLADLCAQALDRAHLYAEAQEARAAAEEAVNLRDRFLSIASHELKTPLTVLLGNAALLQRRAQKAGDLNERYLRSLCAIADQATRLDQLINTLLDSSRIERGQLTIELTRLDLAVLLRQLTGEVRPTLNRHQLIDELPTEAVPIQGDALRLGQLFQNLLYNAVKYSPAGGPITLSLHLADAMAWVEVRDHGIGIPANELPQLFGRFFRASNTTSYHISGMGIGLFVAREIVARHGGTINASNNPEGGSTFRVSLPLADL
ncbi:MAG: MASE1 domain-containing protein [Oscillochloridaceae bacterium umkhey_bin13]